MVTMADCSEKQPTARALMESDIPVVVKEVLDAATEVTVYANGYVLYHVGKYATVFPLHICEDYVYESDADDRNTVKRDVFDNENWYIRLVLEGEDRLEHNQNNRSGDKCFSYSAISEDWAPLGMDDCVLEALIQEETTKEEIGKLLSLVTDRQGYVLMRQYVDQVEQAQLAQELGVTQQAISDMIRKAKRRIQKSYGMDNLKKVRR